MIRSMTAYGRARQEFEDRTVTVEIRSVNSRWFDCSVKLPRTLLYLEDKIKAFVQNGVIARGKVEIYLTVENHSSGIGTIDVDMEFARGYVAALRRLRDELSLPDDISVMAVAKNPDVFAVRRAEEDTDGEWDRVRGVLEEACRGFSRMREAEGDRTLEDFREKLRNVSVWRDEIARLSASDVGNYRDKLETRLRALLGDAGVTVDENRLLTECAVFADRIAIDEELSRLSSHMKAFEEIAAAKEPSGKKLDFLMQEMNRETNTIGSKCQNAEIAGIVVKIKNELEKVREQIQNIE